METEYPLLLLAEHKTSNIKSAWKESKCYCRSRQHQSHRSPVKLLHFLFDKSLNVFPLHAKMGYGAGGSAPHFLQRDRVMALWTFAKYGKLFTQAYQLTESNTNMSIKVQRES